MHQLTSYLLTVANLYTALWIAVNIPFHEPNTVIVLIEWGLIAVAIFLNLKHLATYIPQREAGS